jgi:hypothetical protein
MKRKLRLVFWIESVLTSLTAILTVLSVVRRDWVEQLCGFDPDAHSGLFEWKLVAFLCLATVLFASLVWREWYRESRLAESGGN